MVHAATVAAKASPSYSADHSFKSTGKHHSLLCVVRLIINDIQFKTYIHIHYCITVLQIPCSPLSKLDTKLLEGFYF